MQPDVMIIKTGNKIRAYCLVRSTSKNVIPEKMNEFLYSEYEKNPVRTYLTKGGEKKEV